MSSKSLLKITAFALTTLAALGMLAACAPPTIPDQTSPTPPLEGTTWQLQSYVGADGNTQTAAPQSPATLTFEQNKLAGSTGCNAISGAYTQDGDKLTLQPGPMTQMACPEPLAKQEKAFLDDLKKTASYQIKDGQLMLQDADGHTLMTFGEQQPASLTGGVWQLQRYNNGKGGLVSDRATAKITATFGEDGKVAGNAGCNHYNGSYQVDGDKISIGPLASTRKMCAEPEHVMETENSFLQAMNNAATYAIKGDTLTLFDESGTKLLVFKAQR